MTTFCNSWAISYMLTCSWVSRVDFKNLLWSRTGGKKGFLRWFPMDIIPNQDPVCVLAEIAITGQILSRMWATQLWPPSAQLPLQSPWVGLPPLRHLKLTHIYCSPIMSPIMRCYAFSLAIEFLRALRLGTLVVKGLLQLGCFHQRY